MDSITYSIIEVKPSCATSTDGRLALSPITGGGGNGQPANYQINWNTAPTINQEVIVDLSGNTAYEVTVTDQLGCTQTLSRFLEAPDPININLAKRDISCFGSSDGQISIAAISSNVAVVEYNWSTNIADTTTAIASNLAAGNYTLAIVDEDGCAVTASTTIVEPAAIQIISSEIIPNICSDANLGKILLSISGGNAPFTYQWSDGSSEQNLINVASGNYQISIRDANNCALLDSFELTDPNALGAAIETTPISCFEAADGQIDITAMGGVAPYTYSLNGMEYDGIRNIIGLTAGTYSVSIKDFNNCIWQSDVILLDNPLPFSVRINSEKTVISVGDSLDLRASFQNNNGNIQYSWTGSSPNTFDCPIVLCSSISVKPTVNTTYELYAVDSNGCEASDEINIAVTKNKKIFVPTGFSPNGDGHNDYLLVHGEEGIIIRSFQLFNRWGEIVFESNELTPNNPKNTWDGTYKGQPLNAGVYAWLLEVAFADGTTEILKGSTSLIR